MSYEEIIAAKHILINGTGISLCLFALILYLIVAARMAVKLHIGVAQVFILGGVCLCNFGVSLQYFMDVHTMFAHYLGLFERGLMAIAAVMIVRHYRRVSFLLNGDYGDV